jgi:protein required for attachment to host cells
LRAIKGIAARRRILTSGAASAADIRRSLMKNWLVIANASRARVLEETGEAGVYAHVADMVHPDSRLKGEELATDRPGHAPGPSAHGTGSTAFDPRSDPRERAHDAFAREVAALLDAGVADGRCGGVVLAASNPFLGLVKAHLADRTTKALLRTVAADYTALTEREIALKFSA